MGELLKSSFLTEQISDKKTHATAKTNPFLLIHSWLSLDLFHEGNTYYVLSLH